MVKEFLILLVELFIISYSMGYIINKFIIKPICGVISESTKDKTLLMIDIVDGYGKAKELIDNIISDSIQEYVVLNPNILMEKEYITTDNENKIREDIKNLVTSKLSDNTISVLSTYYNDISEVIATRIYIAVTDFVSSNNTNSEE